MVLQNQGQLGWVRDVFGGLQCGQTFDFDVILHQDPVLENSHSTRLQELSALIKSRASPGGGPGSTTRGSDSARAGREKLRRTETQNCFQKMALRCIHSEVPENLPLASRDGTPRLLRRRSALTVPRPPPGAARLRAFVASRPFVPFARARGRLISSPTARPRAARGRISETEQK
jgi:hypothetical protein